MAIDYREVLDDLETRKAEYQDRIAKIDAAIAGIKALEQPEQVRLGSMPLPFPRQVPRRGLFGRDPSQPTLAERAVAVMPQNGDPIHVTEIQRKIKEDGKDVRADVLRDTLTRKDRPYGRFV
jgi:hypothetical protein